MCAGEAYVGERDRLGMAIREWDARASWLLQVLYALFAEMQSQGGGDAGKCFALCCVRPTIWEGAAVHNADSRA